MSTTTKMFGKNKFLFYKTATSEKFCETPRTQLFLNGDPIETKFGLTGGLEGLFRMCQLTLLGLSYPHSHCFTENPS